MPNCRPVNNPSSIRDVLDSGHKQYEDMEPLIEFRRIEHANDEPLLLMTYIEACSYWSMLRQKVIFVSHLTSIF